MKTEVFRVAKRNSYKIEICCSYCGRGDHPRDKAQEVSIFNGVSVEKSLSTIKCINCGHRALVRKEPK